MICFLRCAPISEDIRLRKYTEACISRNIDFFAITWDRMKRNVKEDYEIQFQMLAPYGNRYKNAFSRIIWQFFVFIHLFQNRNKYSVIHVTNFENILPALLIKFLFSKNVLYDVYDFSSIDISNKIFYFLINRLDKFCVKYSDVLILPVKERLSQMNIESSDYNRFFEVENVPNIKDVSVPINNMNINNIKLSYVGDFDFNRGLKELLEFVNENNQIILNIAGRGSLGKLVEDFSTKNSRIVYHGQVPYEKGIEIMKNSDFIIGMYYTNNRTLTNHIYAAPNKYCESLYIAKPLITTLGTLVGDRVQEKDTGYAICENKESLQNLFNEYHLNNSDKIKEYNSIIKNAAQLWNQKYVDYFDKVLKTDYIDLVLSLN